MYDVINGWKNIRFVCCKNHKEPQQMQEMAKANSIFYACPKYFPENRDKDEPACINAIFINDAEKAVKEINDRLGAAAMKEQELNMANVKFTIDNVDYTVLKDDNGKMDVAVYNRKMVRK